MTRCFLFTLVYHFQLSERRRANHLTFQDPHEKFGWSSNQEGLAFPCLPFVQLWYGSGVAKTSPVGHSETCSPFSLLRAQIQSPHASTSKQVKQCLTKYMKTQHNLRGFISNTKPPELHAWAKENKHSDTEIFPKNPYDQPRVLKKVDGCCLCCALSCH